MLVKLLVYEDGSVGQVLVIDARPKGFFEESVRKAAPHWKFAPGKLDGQPVTAWVQRTVQFDLN